MIISSGQLNLDLFGASACPFAPSVAAAIEALSSEPESGSRGAVFTRTEVVEFILDLVGYTPDKHLSGKRLLEPSSGNGAFLLPAIGRLLAAWEKSPRSRSVVAELGDTIRAVEMHRETFAATKADVIELLMRTLMDEQAAEALANRWLTNGDFLLTPIDGRFDFVVGNPPYVRQELIPAPLLQEYRARYKTMFDRADLYVPFIERSLSLLVQSGRMGLICADRWMKNRYGGPLRRLVAQQFTVRTYVDMVDTPAFQSTVIAYPAIIVISRDAPGPTRVAHRPTIHRDSLAKLSTALNAQELPADCGLVRELPRITNGAEPWLLESLDQTSLIRRLEAQYPQLEAVGCKVGIGVATGADDAFIGDFASLDVEPDRKLPLVTTKDILTGEVQWRGQGIINPFTDDGRLVDLRDYPRLFAYLEARRAAIAGRHCARKFPSRWYRTIDRIHPELAMRPKLLIPDIKGEANIVYEGGKLYPHHNLYYVTSKEWDLRALQAVLLSSVTRLFITTYSTKMRGGFLRFQAQYLRRIRIPAWASVPAPLRLDLVDAAMKRDVNACNHAVHQLYGIDAEEQFSLGDSGD